MKVRVLLEQLVVKSTIAVTCLSFTVDICHCIIQLKCGEGATNTLEDGKKSYTTSTVRDGAVVWKDSRNRTL
jgi:hypothetical protein